MGLSAFKGRTNENVVISDTPPALWPNVKELVVGHSKCYGDCICIPKEFFPSLALVACDIHIFSLPCTITVGRQSYGPKTQLVVRRVSSESRELLLELGHGRQLQHPDAQWFQILKSISTKTCAESSSSFTTKLVSCSEESEMLEAFRTPSALSSTSFRAAAVSDDASGSGVAGPGLCAAGSKGLDGCQRNSSFFSETVDSNRPCSSPQCSSHRHHDLRHKTDSAEPESAMLYIDGNDVDDPTPTEAVRPSMKADASFNCGSSSFHNTDAVAPELLSKHIQQPFSVSLLLRKKSKTHHLHNASLALSNSRFFTGSHTPSTASNTFPAAREQPKQQCFSVLQNQQPSRSFENATYRSSHHAPANAHDIDEASHRGLITSPLLAYRTPEIPMSSDTTTQATTPPQQNTPRTPRQSRVSKERHRSATRPRISRRRKGRSARRRSYSDESYSTDDSFPQHHPGALPPQESTRLTRSGLRY